MAVWAYQCKPCGPDGADSASSVWWVSCQQLDALPASVTILRVKTGKEWRCAVVDRSRRVDVEASLLRDAVASDLQDCPECAAPAPAEAEPVRRAATPATLQAAAISIAGRAMLVVLVGLDLVRSPGEAAMLIADLRPRFGGVDVVLMGQEEDGTPRYHGEPDLVALLADVPLEGMPWKAYPVA